MRADTAIRAGKTTVVKIPATTLRADAGTATVTTSARWWRGCAGSTGRARIADGLLERFHLTDAADRRAATYSWGMRRGDIWVALGWCVVILVVAYAGAMATYHRRTA